MTWRFTIIACLFALAAVGIGAAPQEPASPAPVATPMRFAAIEIWLDSADQPLAAYQIEFKPTNAFNASVKVVGIEGGAAPAFASPPYYDPAAMQQERVIIAAFSTAKADDLPRGRTRIATIHVQIIGAAEPAFDVTTMTAATADGREISAIASMAVAATP